MVAAGGQGHGRRKDQSAADPGVRAQMFAEQFDAQPGAERRFDVQEDSGARGRHMMDAPVPKQRGRGRAQQAADGQRDPGGELTCAKGGGAALCESGIHQSRAEYPDGQHHGTGENGVGSNYWRTVRLHQFLAEQNPRQGDHQRDHDHQVADERGSPRALRRPRLPPSTMSVAPIVEPQTASQPKGRAVLRRQIAAPRGQQHRHRAHHQRGVAHRGSARP